MPDILERKIIAKLRAFSSGCWFLGSLQANEVLKTIIGLQNDLNGNILIFDAFKMNLRKIKILKNSKCLNKCSK